MIVLQRFFQTIAMASTCGERQNTLHFATQSGRHFFHGPETAESKIFF